MSVNPFENRLLVTIDTEPDCDVKWRRSQPLSFDNITIGIPKYLRPIWNRLKVNPIYFITPEILRNEAACETLRDEVRLGAIIGTHLHSEFAPPEVTIEDPAGKPSMEFPCFAHSTEVEFQKLKWFTNSIEESFGQKPIWYRAARFGADLDTIHSLRKLGYLFDSSVTPELSWTKSGGPDHSRAPKQPYWISSDDMYMGVTAESSTGILEVPLTISGKRAGVAGRFLPESWLFYRWLRPTQMTGFEQRRLIDEFVKRFKSPTLVLMFHSMEILPNRSPYVRNRWMQSRFLKNLEKTIAYAIDRYGFEP